jgi:alpha-galactosidase
MGYSSWNDCGSVVTEEHIKSTATYMIQSGLAAKGYTYVNVDEGWLLGRDAKTNEMIEDKNFFPSGMKGLGAWIHDLDVKGQGKIMKYGLYTSRGVTQCDTPEYQKRCLHTPPNPATMRCEGTNGYEAIDAQWLVDAGADYIKEDSCGGNQTHSVAFSDYAKMRDALNKSGTAAGRPIFFSLCGWEEWYAPPDPTVGYGGGKTLGNSYRIHGDGSSWSHLSGCTNTIAAIGEYSGPGHWADPDLLIGPETKQPMHIGGQSDSQARTQFNLWAIFPAPLLISQNVLTWSKYALETYSNSEVIAVNQDMVVHGAGARIAGGDLSFPCTPSAADTCSNVWGRVLADKSLAIVLVNNANGTATVTCDTACFKALADASSVPISTGPFKATDLWSTEGNPIVIDVASVAGGFSAPVAGGGGSRIFKLTASA